jgi:hypothetical protein
MIKNDTLELKKTLVDGATGCRTSFRYRRPTNAEQLAYDRKVSKGKKPGGNVERIRRVARDMIRPLISGIAFPDEEKALGVQGGDGQYRVLSSTPGQPGYREDWLKVIEEVSPRLIQLLGLRVFAADTEDDDDDEEINAPNS